jgi:hypothetical protein
MRRALRFFILFIFFISYQGYAADFKWGKVSDRDRALTACAYELDAPAVVLFDLGQMEVLYGRQWQLKRHRRIKVLNKEGVGQAADMVFNYYSKDDIEQIIAVKAQTINGDEITKVSRSEIYTVDLKNNYSQVRLTFPNVKEGSILEVSYKFISKSYTFLDAWDFQSEYPTLHSEVSAKIEEGLNYKVKLNGRQLTTGYGHLTTNKWTLKNLRSLQEKQYVFNIHDYAESIKFQLESYYRYENGGFNKRSGTVTVLKDWASLVNDDDIQAWIKGYLGRKTLSSKLVASMNLQHKEPIDQIKILYQYVAKQVEWDKKYNIKPKLNFNKLLDEKRGNSADVNMFLTALLNGIGIEAFPAYLSTRSHGVIFKSHPFLTQFNHTIVAVKLDGKYIFLDATSPDRPFDMLSIEDMNEEVLVLNQSNPEWVKLPKSMRFHQIMSVNIDYTQLPRFEAQIEIVNKGYAALQERKTSTEDLENNIVNGLNKYFDITLDSMVVGDRSEVGNPFNVHYYITGTVDESSTYYLPYILNSYFNESPFRQDERYYPIQLSHPYKLYYISKIMLPDNYEVGNLPEQEAGKLRGNSGLYSFNYSRFGKSISVTSMIELKKYNFQASIYPDLQEFFSRVISKQEEQLVLIGE